MFYKFLIFFIFSLLITPSEGLKINFGNKLGSNNWGVINDGVMGGLSRGEATLKANSIRFKGKVSLANNGGFASLRSPYKSIDLSSFEKLRIRYKSKGIGFAFTLEHNTRFYQPYFKHSINPKSDEWNEIEIPLTEFKEYRLGKKTGNHLTKYYLDRIIRIGIISNEKREGAFDIELDFVEFL